MFQNKKLKRNAPYAMAEVALCPPLDVNMWPKNKLGLRFEPQTSRSKYERVNARLSGIANRNSQQNISPINLSDHRSFISRLETEALRKRRVLKKKSLLLLRRFFTVTRIRLI